MSGPESVLCRHLRDKLPPRVQYHRIETTTGQGVPDILLELEGRCCWVECKIVRTSTVITLNLSNMQRAWLRKHTGKGGSSWVLGKRGKGHGAEYFLVREAEVDERNRVEYFHATDINTVVATLVADLSGNQP